MVRLVRAAVAMLVLAAPLPAATQPSGEAAARERAWRLATLAERLGKLHAQAGQGVLPERARRALTEALRDFDALLRDPRTAAAEPRESDLLLALLWREYRPLLARPATREAARRLSERSEELAWVALKAARALPAGPDAVRRASQAAHAGVLAQRVARLHLLRRWDLRDEPATRELARATSQLLAALESLKAEAGNSADVMAELEVAENQRVFLARAAEELAVRPTAAAPLEVVAKTGDNLLESLQRVARLYEARPISAAGAG